jgi:hypothetical protein
MSTAAADYAAAPYRQLAFSSAEQRREWETADTLLHARMREHVPAALEHNGEESFDHHLVGVQSVLRSWDAPEHLCNAALFHSIYGTEGFQAFSLPLSMRGELVDLIGPKAERLAWIFCMVDRASVDATILGPSAKPPDEYRAAPPSFRSRAELGRFEMPLESYEEWLDFLTLSLADWLEQVEGASTKAVPRPVGDGVLWNEGEAWGYRRHAYAKMAELVHELAGVEAAAKMHAEVYAREPEASRAFVQPLTPPMSEAALAAAEALESLHFASR